jgi:hypothetical protein
MGAEKGGAGGGRGVLKILTRIFVKLSGLVSFSQWIHLEAKDHDLEFVQTVLYFSTQILHRTSSSSAGSDSKKTVLPKKQQQQLVQQQQQQQIQQQQQWKSAPSRPESNFFHIHPRKVTEVRA